MCMHSITKDIVHYDPEDHLSGSGFEGNCKVHGGGLIAICWSLGQFLQVDVDMRGPDGETPHQKGQWPLGPEVDASAPPLPLTEIALCKVSKTKSLRNWAHGLSHVSVGDPRGLGRASTNP